MPQRAGGRAGVRAGFRVRHPGIVGVVDKWEEPSLRPTSGWASPGVHGEAAGSLDLLRACDEDGEGAWASVDDARPGESVEQRLFPGVAAAGPWSEMPLCWAGTETASQDPRPRDCATAPRPAPGGRVPGGSGPLPGQPVRRALPARGWHRLQPVLLNANTCKEALPNALPLRRTFKNTLQILPWPAPVANPLKNTVWFRKL